MKAFGFDRFVVFTTIPEKKSIKQTNFAKWNIRDFKYLEQTMPPATGTTQFYIEGEFHCLVYILTIPNIYEN